MRNRFILIVILAITTWQSICQEMISYNVLAALPEALVELNLNTDVDNGVVLYRMLYTSKDLEGDIDTVSGLVAVPDTEDSEFAPLIYQHGTVDGPDDVPSKLKGGYELALIYGAYGFLTIAPDMLGLGESRGIHPYVHAGSEASVAVDMLFALNQFAEDRGFEIKDQVFVTGYSQGGHAAMAAHRSLQQDYADEFTVAGSAPMSGPYDISGKMSDFTLGEQDYGFVAYLAYTALSYQAAYKNLFDNDALETFFKPAYVDDILTFKNGEIGLFELNDRLLSTLQQEEGRTAARLMLQPEVLDGILNDPTHPASVALRDNDVYEWVPQAPTRLYYCTEDEQVWFENALVAEAYMNTNGAPDLKAVNMGAEDHGGCVFPAVTDAIDFFKGIRDVTSPTLEISQTSISIFPSPANDFLNIQVNGDLSQVQIVMTDLQGKVWYNENLTTNKSKIATANIPNGIYTLSIHEDSQVKNTKVVIQH